MFLELFLFAKKMKFLTKYISAGFRERLFAVHGLSERTTVQTSSLLLRLFFFYLLANPTQPDPYR